MVIVGASRRFLAQITRPQNEVKYMSASLQYSDYSGVEDFIIPYDLMGTGQEEGYLRQCSMAMKIYQEMIRSGVDNDSVGYRAPQGDICKLSLGFGLKILDGYAGYIFLRSGLSSQGIVCELPSIDSGYAGEVHAIISNVGNREYEIKMDDKVGKLVIMPILIPDFTFENWKERGTKVFGSTGR